MAFSSNNHHTNPSAGYPAGANGVHPTASTAYPYYPNPDPSAFYYSNNPNPINPPYYQPHQNPNPRRNLFLRRLLVIFVSIFVAIGAVTLIVYLVLRPKLPEFSLTSLSVSNFTLSSASSSLSSSFDLSLSVHNPNSKMTVGYDRVLADVAVDGDPVASTYLAPFTQPKGSTTNITAKMAATGVFVDSHAVDAIHSGRGVVDLDVRVVAVVRFWSRAWRTRRHELRVFCGDVEVKFRNGTAGDGSMTGGPRQCWVGI
ncbi:proline-rich receptor-like protein kinase PERK9 [Iris pallida]|uniref:Proline-rich receptor-like protein kinase PERK9 n=1 Tax=Iris pallida TaxID=29817 RepID=A0AAX6H1C0_IRIPA|nr:proline-rich receptor-like protein kinase PERK9 [Iris pallida]